MAEVDARADGVRNLRTKGGSRVMRFVAAGAVASVVSAVAAVAVDIRPAAAVDSRTFVYTGTTQYFTVPLGVTSVLVEAWGAQGYGAGGGRGGYVRGFLAVRPGEGLAINVGGSGDSTAGGWNGGGNRGGGTWTVPGGGGGASDVRRGTIDLSSRVLVAGGGGGAADSRGGDGGYPTATKGGDNGVSSSQQGAEGGYGGESFNSGRGGYGGPGGFGFCGVGDSGQPGSGGAGGTGTYAGGGGGGGYFGGGGGGVGCFWGGAGGGGGSSWADSTVAGALYKTGVGYGNGRVVVAYSPDGWPSSMNAPAAVTDPTGEVVLDPLHQDAVLHDRTVAENLGDSDVSSLGTTPYQASPLVVAAKEARLAELQPWLTEQVTMTTKAQITPVGPDEGSLPCPTAGCAPAAKELTQPLSYQQRAYWSGPAVTELVLQQMRGTAPTQSTLANEEGTEQYKGTSPDAIARSLNSRLPLETFYTKTLATGPYEYLAAVVGAVHYENHPVVNNVRTAALAYWGPLETSAPAKTYNISYGYSFSSGGLVWVADQFDTSHVPSTRTVNPYGFHVVRAAEMHQAIMDNKGVVVW